MKVAFLSFDFGEYCVRLVSALGRQADILLLLPKGHAAPHLSLLAQTVLFQPFKKPRFRQPLHQIRMIYTLIQNITRFAPDLIHLQQGHLWFNFALPFLNQFPLVLTIHDVRHHVGDRESQKTPQVIMDFAYRRANQIIVHNKQMRNVVVEDYGVPPQMVHIIPHIALGDEMAAAHVQEDGQRILFFGRIWQYKGLEYLIRAEPIITAEVPSAKIIIAGRGERFNKYRRMMVHPDQFIVHNEHVSDDMLATLFRQSSVVVLPYIEASQSGVIPLAYTFGKPVIATSVGGLPDMVEHGRTGYLIPPRDEKALAEACIRLLRDSHLRREFGSNGKRKIDAECSADVVARHTLAVYLCALGRTSSRLPERRSI